MRTTLLLASVSLLMAVCGCQKPVNFPAETDAKAASALNAVGAYDANHDGKLNFFTFASDDGRIDRIGYDTSGDGKPDRIVSLDAARLGRYRHLVIILDGFGYDLIRQYRKDGGLRLFHEPSRIIAPYPTLTDVCMEDIFGYVPCEGFEAVYYDRKLNRVMGGSGDYMAGKNQPYNHLLQYRADMIFDAIGYIEPWAVFGKEINDAKRRWDQAKTQEFLAYFVSSAGMGTQMGTKGQIQALKRTEQFINQVIYETNGLTKITLLSDHGHSYTPATRIDFVKELQGRNWRAVKSLQGEKDFAHLSFGLVTCASFATNSPAKLAADLVQIEGVELASYADGDSAVLLGRDGQKAIIRQKANKYKYETITGDPLKLQPILAKIPADADGYREASQLFTATVEHEYPAPLQRIWRAHFALITNPPDVIASLENKYFAGLASLAGSVNIASTHGGLNRDNSTTFIMSTAGPMPEAMQSKDIPAAMKNLLKHPWPMGK